MKVRKGNINIKTSDTEVNKLMLSKYDPNMIYKNPGGGRAFGDSLAWASFIARLSEASGMTITVCKFSRRSKTIFDTIFDTTGSYIHISENSINEDKICVPSSWEEVYSWKNIPAKKLWSPTDSKIIAYQFGTGGAKDRQIKTQQEKNIIFDMINEKGFKSIELGAHLSNEECIEIAANCDFFVGTCSGMSHLCHSVNTPVHIICNDRPISKVKLHHSGNNRPTMYYKTPQYFVDYLRDL